MDKAAELKHLRWDGWNESLLRWECVLRHRLMSVIVGAME